MSTLIIFLGLILQIPLYGGVPENDLEKVQIESDVSSNKTISEFDNILNHLKDILGPAIALFGILMTLPILRKKLIENHIITSLNEIHSANSEVLVFNQNLIDKYISYTYMDSKMSKQDIEIILKDIQKGFHLSQKASSDVVTLMYYLKNVVQNTVRNYDSNSLKCLTSASFLGFIITILELVNFYTTQVVQIPKSSKTQSKNIIIKSLRRFVTYSNINQYKHFKLGIINDPDSAHFLIFCDKANKSGHPLLLRSTFQIHWNPNSIAKILYLEKIYAPSILEKSVNNSMLGIERLVLYLVGFILQNQFSDNPNDPKRIVKLIYSNPNDFYHFVSGLTYDKLKSDFVDSWVINSDFYINNSISMENIDFETISLKFDKCILENLFHKNIKKIKNKIKIESRK